MHIRFTYIYCLITGLLLFSPFLAFGREGGGGDTIRNPHSYSELPPISGSVIQRMTRVELLTLIDHLLDLDSIPRSIIDELRDYITHREEEGYNAVSAQSCSTYPAEDIYPGWDQKNFFSYRNNFTKNDTSALLVLQSSVNGTYTPPCPGRVTSNFGWRDSAQHNGIDIDLNKGDKVLAAFDGMVRIATRHGAYGNVVIVRHYNGLETVYAHLSKIKVKPGQVVLSGQVIGLGGSTGRSTGPHLHFEVRFMGQPVNPRYLISFEEQDLLCDTIIIKKTRWGIAAYPKNSEWHTVAKGDNLFEIAKRYGITTARLAELNGFSRRTRLKPGQKLKVADNSLTLNE
jgi:murein DD-endopeptidase MepM/ murein hydrolase activator NlpD